RATSRPSRTRPWWATRSPSSSALPSGNLGAHERDEARPSCAQRGIVALSWRAFVGADRGAEQVVPVRRQRVERPLGSFVLREHDVAAVVARQDARAVEDAE